MSSLGEGRGGGGEGPQWPKWQIVAAAIGLGIIVTGAVGSIWYLSSRGGRKKRNEVSNNIEDPTPSVSINSTPNNNNNTETSTVELVS